MSSLNSHGNGTNDYFPTPMTIPRSGYLASSIALASSGCPARTTRTAAFTQLRGVSTKACGLLGKQTLSEIDCSSSPAEDCHPARVPFLFPNGYESFVENFQRLAEETESVLSSSETLHDLEAGRANQKVLPEVVGQEKSGEVPSIVPTAQNAVLSLHGNGLHNVPPTTTPGSTAKSSPHVSTPLSTAFTKGNEEVVEQNQASQPLTSPSHKGNRSNAVLKIPSMAANGTLMPPTSPKTVSPKGKEKANDQRPSSPPLDSNCMDGSPTPSTPERLPEASPKLHYKGAAQNFTPRSSPENSQARMVTPQIEHANRSVAQPQQPPEDEQAARGAQFGLTPNSYWMIPMYEKREREKLKKERKTLLREMKERCVRIAQFLYDELPDPDDDIARYAPLIVATNPPLSIRAPTLLPMIPGVANLRESERFRIFDPSLRRANTLLTSQTIQALSSYDLSSIELSDGDTLSETSSEDINDLPIVSKNSQETGFFQRVWKPRAATSYNAKFENGASLCMVQRGFNGSNTQHCERSFPREPENGETSRVVQWRHKRFNGGYPDRDILPEQSQAYHDGAPYKLRQYRQRKPGLKSAISPCFSKNTSARSSPEALQQGMDGDLPSPGTLFPVQQTNRARNGDSSHITQQSETPLLPPHMDRSPGKFLSRSSVGFSSSPGSSMPRAHFDLTSTFKDGTNAVGVGCTRPRLFQRASIIRQPASSQPATTHFAVPRSLRRPDPSRASTNHSAAQVGQVGTNSTDPVLDSAPKGPKDHNLNWRDRRGKRNPSIHGDKA